MKFIVSSQSLFKNIQSIGGVLNSSNTLEILDNFLFELEDKILRVYASDLETTMSVQLEVESTDDSSGSIAIPARILLDILKTFSDQPLTFLINTETFSIDISSDNGKYKISGFDAVEFPKIPVLENLLKLEIDTGILYSAISKTIFATGNDEIRPVINGVYFEIEKNAINFIATDAHKLSLYSRSDIKSTTPTSFIIPKKPLNLIKNILLSKNSKLIIQYNEINVNFKFENIELTSRLIEGSYPNYKAVIPKDNPNELIIDRQMFLESIKRLSIFSNKTTHQTKLEIKGKKLRILAEDNDYSNEAVERLACQYVGDDIEIGFNSRFLAEMLSNLESEQVKLKLGDPSKAGLLFPENENENEKTLMLIMPVMVSGS